MRLGLIILACLLTLTVAAQQQQNGEQQGSLGTVRNERNSTMPQAATTANGPTQNELVGCVGGSGSNLTLTQSELRRTYQLRGNTGQLQNSAGKMVKVTGKLILGQQSAFEVQQVTPLEDKCQYEQNGAAYPATGKTGANHDALNVTSTNSSRQTTPGAQTEAGVKQNPSTNERPQQYGANSGGSAPLTASQGAPTDSSANPANADNAQRIANAAQQSELSNSKATLGVNAQPNYSNAKNPQANAQAIANQAQQERGQAAAGDAGNPKGGERQAAGAGQNAQQLTPGTGGAPVFTGCLTQSGNSYFLNEKSSNEKFRIAGDTSKLKEHVNHMVQIVGNKTGTHGSAVGTSGDTQTLFVQAIQDSAPTCQQ